MTVDSAAPGTGTRAFAWKVLLAYSLSRVVPVAVVFASTPILLGLIGTAQYGLYTTITALVLIAESLGVGWLRQAALRGTGDPRQAMHLLPRWSIASAVNGPAVLVALLLVLLSGALGAGHDPALLATATALCCATGFYMIRMTRAQRDMQVGRVVAIEWVRAIAGLLASIAMHATLLEGASAALAGMAIGNVAGALVAGRGLRAASHDRTSSSANALLRAYWSYGWPMSLWLAASSGLLYVDRLLLSVWLGPEVAGQYGAVSDLVIRGYLFIATPVSMAVHPLAMAAWNQGRPDVAVRTIVAYQRILSFLMVGATAALVAAGPSLIPIVVGVPAPSTAVLVFLGLGSAIWQFSLLTQKRLEMAGHSLTVLSLMGASALVTAAVDVALIPLTGPLGAAMGMAAGAVAYQVGCLRFGVKAVAP
jgi:O-antigen/teichoic acid export membrane protein